MRKTRWVRAWVLGVLGLAELIVSAAVHLAYGAYIFFTAVAADLSQCLVDGVTTPVAGELISEAVLDAGVPPIVLVHGIFGFGRGRLGGLSYFAGAEKKDDRVLVPDLGSLTSVHDRAQDSRAVLLPQRRAGGLRGGAQKGSTGTLSLAEPTHAVRPRKLNYLSAPGILFYLPSADGRVAGHYTVWDEEHPVHFVGHSAGAQVIRLLQQMLHDKAFEGYDDTSERWVLSVISLSGALNGTTRAYLDGMQAEDGRSLKPACLLQICRVGCILYHWLDVPWLERYYDFGFDHFPMSRRTVGMHGLPTLLVGDVGPFATGDWILPDLTIQGAARINASVRTFPCTFYFSYASRRTAKVWGGSGILRIHPLLFIRVLQMCRWRHPSGPPYKGYRDEDWEDNDGAINTISMTHPRIPVEHPSHYVQVDSDCHPLQPDIWYYKIVEADHMTFVINRQRGGVQFDLIYDSIFQNCRKHVFRTAPPPTLPNQS
uniref:Lipase n=1 Tax=Leersia perrieri TaxID=77586 RepID=A0A0D9WXW9_9ORYZ